MRTVAIICLAAILLVALFFSVTVNADGSLHIHRSLTREGVDPDATRTPSPYRTPYQNALEAIAILQDTTIPPSLQIILLKMRLNGTAYDTILSNKSMNAINKIKQIQSILATSALKGQLTARIISEDKRIDTKSQLNMIKTLGDPPPVYPTMFNGKILESDILERIKTKTF